MELKIAKERVLMLIPQFTQEEAKDKAWAKKITAFDTISKFSGLLSRPKDEDFDTSLPKLIMSMTAIPFINMTLPMMKLKQ
jgi:hypothetical protein